MQSKLNRTASTALLSLSLLFAGCGGDGDGENGTTDTDGDGVADSADAFPNDPAESTDTDGDGIGDNADTDDDADGLPDDQDANPLDTDNDTIPNAEDDDDDDDGVPDESDAFPLDSSESSDTDGDGIGDNADPDTEMPTDANPDTTITTANLEGQDFQCIFNPGSNGSAFFDGTFSGFLEADYNIRDNSVGCGGAGGTDSYTFSFQVPDPGSEDPQGVVNLLVNVEGALVVGDNINASGTMAFSNGDRSGVFDLQNCTVSISSLGMAPDQTGAELLLPQGVLDCERAVVSPLFSAATGPLDDIVFDTSLEFLGAVANLPF